MLFRRGSATAGPAREADLPARPAVLRRSRPASGRERGGSVTGLCGRSGSDIAPAAAWGRVPEVPLPHWDDPGLLWIWLPPTGRPQALARFGAGASLRAVVEAVQQAHPALHGRFRRRLDEDLEDDPEDPRPRPDYLVPQLWDAVIAYAVTFMTQTQNAPATGLRAMSPSRSRRAFSPTTSRASAARSAQGPVGDLHSGRRRRGGHRGARRTGLLPEPRGPRRRGRLDPERRSRRPYRSGNRPATHPGRFNGFGNAPRHLPGRSRTASAG